ncbi:hypothetical protein ON010_g3523 [Phytophthora cinnamomi]|nr:hypothetical protein ON010_g3523 [Phytophthora cinnamomi]
MSKCQIVEQERLADFSDHELVSVDDRLWPRKRVRLVVDKVFILSFPLYYATSLRPSNMKLATSFFTLFGSLLVLLATPTSLVNAECSDVHVVFARGSGEAAGLGICGQPLVSGITSDLSGMSVSSYAVNYLASYDQTSAGPGATDMTNHVVSIADECPDTVFVLGGYSQGASVTDIAIGIKTVLGTGDSIPDTLASRIKAIVTFGNPLKLQGETISSASSTYGSKAIEFCNTGDPVCGNGFNMMAHLTYATDGSVTTAAQKAAALVKGGTRALRA